MLLIDLSSVVINAVQGAIIKEPLTQSLVRNVTMSQLLYYKKRYAKYGKPILCVDSRHYWRKDQFKYYKQNRKKIRRQSKMDWELFFEFFAIVKQELQYYVPYYYLEVEKCEADDIIAIIAMKSSEPVMVVSADKDMAQLQTKGKDIKQYSPMTKKQITVQSLSYSLIEHIIRGDSSDGIPNIRSDDDVFLCDDKRQKSITATIINDAIKLKRTELICQNKIELDKFKRNQILIDVAYIPENYKKDIRDAWREQQDNPPKDKLKTYFIKFRMKLLFNKIAQFR